MKAPRAFKVARHKGQHLVILGQGAIHPPQLERHRRIGAQLVCAYPVVTDIELAVKALRKTVALPVGRAEPDIDGFDIGQRHGIARVQQKGGILGHGVFGIEPHRAAGIAVVILEEADDRDIGPDLLEKRQLPPTHMPHHDIGFEPFAGLDLFGRAGGPQTVAGRFLPVLRQPIGSLCRSVMRLVDPCLDAIKTGRVFALGQEIDLVCALIGQPLHQLAVLAGHILVHKHDLHGVALCPVGCRQLAQSARTVQTPRRWTALA